MGLDFLIEVCYTKRKMEVYVMEKVIVKLDDDLFKELQVVATFKELSVQDLIRDWIEEIMIEIRDKGNDFVK